MGLAGLQGWSLFFLSLPYLSPFSRKDWISFSALFELGHYYTYILRALPLFLSKILRSTVQRFFSHWRRVINPKRLCFVKKTLDAYLLIFLYRIAPHQPWSQSISPCEQSLLLSPFLGSWNRGSSWIVSSVWNRRSPNFWTRHSCFLLSNWTYFWCASIRLLTNRLLVYFDFTKLFVILIMVLLTVGRKGSKHAGTIKLLCSCRSF